MHVYANMVTPVHGSMLNRNKKLMMNEVVKAVRRSTPECVFTDLEVTSKPNFLPHLRLEGKLHILSEGTNTDCAV